MKKIIILIIMFCTLLLLAGPERTAFKKADITFHNNVPGLITNITIPMKAKTDAVLTFIGGTFLPAFDLQHGITPKIRNRAVIGNTAIFTVEYRYKGIPVEDARTTLTVKNGKIIAVNNHLPKITIDTSNLIPVTDAVRTAYFRHTGTQTKKLPSHHAEPFIITYIDRHVPVYKVRFQPVSLADTRFYYVNAQTGNVLYAADNTVFADTDPAPDKDEVPDTDTGGTPPEDTAKIYTFNPEKTPDLIDVTLPWVAPHDDADLAGNELGKLTATKDDEDIRKIKAYNCPDEDETVNYQGMIEVPICSPTQLADKIENGNFVFEDCSDGEKFIAEKMKKKNIDRCAEISMYYHTSKIYKYLRDLGTEFSYLMNNDKDRPLNVIGNFQMPDLENIMSGNAGLVAMDNAFFSPENPMLGEFLQDYGVEGDILAFGQGTYVDFGYDGDVVYHEFGHATAYTTGLDSAQFPDKYGMNNEPGSLHEGLADTFSFIMTEDKCTGEYASGGIMKLYEAAGEDRKMDKDGDFWCMRNAENTYTVPDNLRGEVHWDGQPLLATNWAIYNLALDNDISKDDFTRLILKTLYALGTPKGTYAEWASVFMTTVAADDVFSPLKDQIQAIVEERNFAAEIRARDASESIPKLYVAAASAQALPGQEETNDGGISIEEDGETVNIAPAYIQTYIDVPENAENLEVITVTADVAEGGGGTMGMGNGSPELKVFMRKSNPVEYTAGEETTEVAYDMKTEETDTDSGEWKLTVDAGLDPGARYYLQFVNYGDGAGEMENVVATLSESPETADDSDEVPDDSSSSLEDDEIPEEDTGGSSGSSGCSLSIL